MSNFSKTIISGTVVAEPTITSQEFKGKSLTKIEFFIQTKEGEPYIGVYAFGNAAEKASSEVSAGAKVLVAGKPAQIRYKDGEKNRSVIWIRASIVIGGSFNAEVNTTTFEGRLAGDPDVRYTQTGKAVAQFDVAVGRFNKDDGADFLRVVAWEKLAEVCGNNLTKGRRVLVDSRLVKRVYEGTDGKKIETTEFVAGEVIFLEAKRTGSGSEGNQNSSNPFGGQVFPEEEIPF